MNFRHLKSQSGVTLIELLAALSLFAIVLVLASTAIFQLFKGEDQTSSQIEATQLANVAIQDLKSQYNVGNSKICLNEADDTLKIEQVSDGVITGNCIEEIDSSELSVTITSYTEAGKPLTVRTTWTNKTGQGIDVSLIKEEDYEAVIIDEEYMEKNGCNFTDQNKAFHYTLTTIDRECNFTGAHGKFPNDITFTKDPPKVGHAYISVTGNIIFDGSLTFKETYQLEELTIDGKAIFNDDIIVNGNHTYILIKNDAIFNNIILNNNHTTIKVLGNATFNGKVRINSNDSKIEVQQKAVCKDTDLGEEIAISNSMDCSN